MSQEKFFWGITLFCGVLNSWESEAKIILSGPKVTSLGALELCADLICLLRLVFDEKT